MRDVNELKKSLGAFGDKKSEITALLDDLLTVVVIEKPPNKLDEYDLMRNLVKTGYPIALKHIDNKCSAVLLTELRGCAELAINQWCDICGLMGHRDKDCFVPEAIDNFHYNGQLPS